MTLKEKHKRNLVELKQTLLELTNAINGQLTSNINSYQLHELPHWNWQLKQIVKMINGRKNG